IDLSIKETRADITIIEIGGTVGEYQNSMFVEAARVLKLRNPGDVLFALVSYLPVPNKIGEMKTKPTQYAVQTMNSYGVHPDVIIARSDRPLDTRRKEKIAFMSNIPTENIISAPDIESIYDIPLNFEKDSLGNLLLKSLGLKVKKTDLSDWEKMTKRVKNSKEEVQIAIVGKYFKTGDFVLSDVYLSVIESLKHAGAFLGKKVKIDWLDSNDYEKDPKKLKELKKYQGILVPGGFGERGIEGKIRVIQFARENKIPYFGLCYGMQLAVVEFARHALGLKDAHTTEIDPKTKNPVVVIMDEQRKLMADNNYGGTMRLGAYPCVLKEETIAEGAYKSSKRLSPSNKISERHRHRFEVNPAYIEKLEAKGLVFSGTSPDSILMEIAELPRKIHPFFLGSQFHPEFKSSPLNPHPLFVEFIKSASKIKP
ncbi:MAG TPA: CTP synthase, partial [Candidatus Paceibacterota bacterium]|nr:CTP synthase [Candidatus Paceibacterota bacterium]